MDDKGGLLGAATRRKWLAHCTALACASTAAAAHAVSWAAVAVAQPDSLPAVATGKAAPATAKRQTLLVLGDSLSAEYGLQRGTGWVALLEQRLLREGLATAVVNASISGDTTSGGRSRLTPLLRQHRPTHVILELGGNDALRGLPLDMTRANLAEMARASKAAGALVVVAGMQVPPNYGRKYSDEFFALFASVARAEGAALVPFLLKGVADAPNADAMFQADRIHPKEAAHPVMLENVWRVLRPLLAK